MKIIPDQINTTLIANSVYIKHSVPIPNEFGTFRIFTIQQRKEKGDSS